MVRKRRPSKSARDVARVVTMRSGQERYAGIAPEGFGEELGEMLVRAHVTRRWELNLLRRRWVRGWMDWNERILFPGMSAHLLARKRFVEQEVRAADPEQLVVLGAGYDIAAARALRADPDLAALEVDHPPTQALKSLAYEGWDGPRPTLVPLDLSACNLREALSAEPSFRDAARSVFVAEGLVMYLAREEVEELLRCFVALTAPGSRFVLSYCAADEQGRVKISRTPRLMRAMARAVGEPLRWAVRPEDLPAFVAPLGLRVHRQPTREELEAELFPRRDHPLLRLGIEPFVVLER